MGLKPRRAMKNSPIHLSVPSNLPGCGAERGAASWSCLKRPVQMLSLPRIHADETRIVVCKQVS